MSQCLPLSRPPMVSVAAATRWSVSGPALVAVVMSRLLMDAVAVLVLSAGSVWLGLSVECVEGVLTMACLCIHFFVLVFLFLFSLLLFLFLSSSLSVVSLCDL